MRICTSVIIPVYNGAVYLTETLESVRAQDYRSLEVIAVDDGSTVESLTILRSFPEVVCLTQNHLGVASARNRGLEAARGPLIAFLDQDDLWLPSKLSRQVAYLDAHPEAVYVLTTVVMFLSPGVERPAWVRPEWLAAPTGSFFPSVVLARRAAFEQIGAFDSLFPTSSDADWFFRAKDSNLVMGRVEEPLVRKRIHANNQSIQTRLTQRELLEIARASIRRQEKKEE